jgi:transcriptional regulator with XRE-family HTH domain
MSTHDLLKKIGNLPDGPSDLPEVPPPELIGFFVRYVRGLKQWKQGTLADFAGVSISTVERVERGEKVSPEALDAIARGLGFEQGYFTNPRYRRPDEETAADLDRLAQMEPVAVAHMTLHKQVREAANCHAFLIHRPDVPAHFDPEIANLTEWFDIASFVLSDRSDRASASERSRRDLYNDILACVKELERQGLTVLFGMMNAPQVGIPDWRVAIVSITTKALDPGAIKRRYVFVDRSLVALPESSRQPDG